MRRFARVFAVQQRQSMDVAEGSGLISEFNPGIIRQYRRLKEAVVHSNAISANILCTGPNYMDMYVTSWS